MRVEGLVSKEKYPHLASHFLDNAMKELINYEQNNSSTSLLRASSGISTCP